MDFTPFDPLEEAMQNSRNPKIIPQKSYGFLWGVLIAIVIGGIAYFVVIENNKKTKKVAKENETKNTGNFPTSDQANS